MIDLKTIGSKLLNIGIAATLLASIFIPAQVLATQTQSNKYCIQSFDLIKGQSSDIGNVEISTDGTKLYIKITTSGSWEMEQSHVDVGDLLNEIPRTPSGNPIPGNFSYSHNHEVPFWNTGDDTEYTYEINIASSDLSDLIDAIIAVHTQVDKRFEDEESAWGEGTRFKQGQGNWAMYITYTCNPATPTPTPTNTPTVTPSVTPTVTPTPSEEPSITPSVTPTPTDEPSVTPSVTPTPTEEPSITPSVTPTPTEVPSVTPSVTPTPVDEPDPNVFVCKFEDENKNGIWDKNEAGINNWTIKITKLQPIVTSESLSEMISETIEVKTNEDGCTKVYVEPWYSYRIEEETKAGWTQTAPVDPNYCEGNITNNEYDVPASLQVVRDDINSNTLSCDFGNYKETNGGSGTQRRSGSGSQSSDRDNDPTHTPVPTDDSEVLGTATESPSATQEVLARTGFSLIGIAILGLVNLQLALLANDKVRKSILNIICKVA